MLEGRWKAELIKNAVGTAVELQNVRHQFPGLLVSGPGFTVMPVTDTSTPEAVRFAQVNAAWFGTSGVASRVKFAAAAFIESEACPSWIMAKGDDHDDAMAPGFTGNTYTKDELNKIQENDIM